MKEYLEFHDDTSHKYWEITLVGNKIVVHFGRVHTQGQTQEKEFPSNELAMKAAQKLLAEKLGKGYQRVTGTGDQSGESISINDQSKPKPKTGDTSLKQEKGKIDSTSPQSTPPYVFMTEYFELPKGNSGLFWEVSVIANKVIERSGVIGAKDVVNEQVVESEEKAVHTSEALMLSKMKEGYSRNLKKQTNQVTTSSWWEKPAQFCPAGAKVKGGLPRKNYIIYCEDAAGSLNGPLAIFDKDSSNAEMEAALYNNKLHGKLSLLKYQQTYLFVNGRQAGCWKNYKTGVPEEHSMEMYFHEGKLAKTIIYDLKTLLPKLTVSWDNGAYTRFEWHIPRSEQKGWNKPPVIDYSKETRKLVVSEIVDHELDVRKYKDAESLELNNACNLTDIGKVLSGLPKLKSISIKGSWIDFLPKEIGILKDLETLSIQGRLTGLPEEIGQCKKLQKLELGTYCLQAIPESIGNLTELTAINCFSAILEQLPDSIGQLKKLKELNLGAGLSVLTPALGECSALEILLLPQSYFFYLPGEILQKLKKLKRLDLSKSKILKFPGQLALPELAWINLSENHLFAIPDFSLCGQLNEVYLYNNHIASVPAGAFKGLKEPFKMSLQENPIREVAPPLLDLTAGSAYDTLKSFFNKLGKPKKSHPKTEEHQYLKDWPPVLDKLEPITIDKKIPAFIRQIYEEQGITGESKIIFPVHNMKLIKKHGTDLYPECPNIPGHHIENAGGDDNYLKDIGKYIWLDFDLEDAEKKTIPLRLVANSGDADCNDGLWGAAWERETKALVANIMSTGDCQTTIAETAYGSGQYKPYTNLPPFVIYNQNAFYIDNVKYQYGSQLESLIHAAFIMGYAFDTKDMEIY